MPKHATIMTSSLAEHPAFKTWVALRRNHAVPERIEILGRKKKSAVYRLAGVGPGGSAVIAKCCRRESASIERTVYAEILPQLPISALNYYGFAEEPNGEFSWLFVEDAGGKEYAPRMEQHRNLIARWLGLMHAGSASMAAAASLPERGPGHYLEHLRSARETILRNFGNPLLQAEDMALLGTIVSQCDLLETRWNQIERFCDHVPKSLVHGDFVLKNMRVRTRKAATALLLFDWETAGWGVPAADLAQLGTENADLAPYCSTVRELWPHLHLQDIQQLAAVGNLFRLLAMIRRESVELPYQSVRKCMGSMRIYQDEMCQALQTAGWWEGEM